MKDEIKNIILKAYVEGRKNLTEVEVYDIFKVLKLNVPLYVYMTKNDIDINGFSKKIFESIKTDKIVIKIVSSTNLHKTDSGGVKIVERNEEKIKEVLRRILDFKDIDGVLAMEFITHSPFAIGEELLLGAKNDEAFGPIITIGPGGTHTESFIKALRKDIAPSFLCVYSVNGEDDIERFIENTWIFNYLLGKVRGLKQLCDKKEIIQWIEGIIKLTKYFNDEGDEFTIEEVEVNPLALSNGKLYSLDGVLRFRKSENKKRDIPSNGAINSIVEPKTIAIVGVSEKKMNMGRIILNNTIKAGFDKKNIFVIKEGVNEIDGVKAYPDIKSLPSKIDMCVVAVPVEGLIEVMRDISESGKMNGVVLITGGVGEKSGSEDIAKKINDFIKLAREKNKNFALNGGNCMGIVLNNSKVNTFFIPEYKMHYPLGSNPYMVKSAFVSQSGAFVISTLTKIPYVIPDYTITVGNQQDITVVDYLDYFSKTDVKVILSYIEGFKYKDGFRLVEIVKRARNYGKVVVLYKAGRTSLGQKAVMGHTASIAGNYLIFEKLLKEAGAIVCDDFEEFCDMSFLSTYLSKYEIKGKKAFLISNAGFETTGMADNISFLNVEKPSDKLKEKIDEILKKYKLDSIVDFKNPMDTTPMAGDDAIKDIINGVIDEYDVILLSMVPLTPNLNTLPSCSNYPDNLERSFINYITGVKKPVIFCVASGNLYDPYVEYASRKGFVTFRTVDRMVKTVEKYLKALL